MTTLSERRAKMTDASAYRALTLDEAADILCGSQKYLILFHVHPDGDAVGSAFALRAMLESCGREAYCICADEVPERLLFASERYQGSVLPDSIPNGFEPEKIISVDTASPSQLGELYEVYGGRIDMMIDHHGKGTSYADFYTCHEASACGEVLYGLLRRVASNLGCGDLPLSVKGLIYMAISSDTGCFRYNNTTPEAHRIAASLIEGGVQSTDINHRLFGIKTLRQMQVEHAGFERMNFYAGGRIAVIAFPYALKEQYGATDENLETLIDVARSVKGVEVAAVVKQLGEDGRFRVSMRSSSDLDVSEICAQYGGGGHCRAAGCSLNCDSILTAEMTVVTAVEMRLSESDGNEE